MSNFFMLNSLAKSHLNSVCTEDVCDKSENAGVCAKWQWNVLDWCYWIALLASPVVQSSNTISCVSLSFRTHLCVLAIEIHNGRIRYGDVPQHHAGTSKNTVFCCPLPVSARCSWWQVTFVTHLRCQYNIIGWLGYVYRRSNDSFDQNTPHKHIIIVNLYIGCNGAIVGSCYHIL